MFTSQEGKKVPQVTFHTRQGDQWIDVTTDDLFKDKTVIVFSLPGAFTPTCSSSHLPRYNELSSVFKQHGVDSILCVSVNDTFVMNAWKADLGFGPRSWRYSMLVRNGVVEKMFVEPNKPGDPFEVSDADTMLKYLAPEFQVQESVSLFTKPGCPFCAKAKQMLQERGIQYEEIVLGQDATTVSLRAVSGRATVPQVFIGGRHIGGSDDLENFLSA
jgi:glutaredoxin-like protein